MHQRPLLYLMAAAIFACGGSGPGNNAGGPHDEGRLSPECTQFLDGYEKYVDDYIQLLKDYKSNPTDLSLMQRVTNMAEEAKTWSDKAAPSCKDAAAFVSRQLTIQAKLTQASFSL